MYKLLFGCCLLFPPSHLLSIKVTILADVVCHCWLSSTKWSYVSKLHFSLMLCFFYSGCYGERHFPRAKTGCSEHRETNCTQHVVLKRHWGIASSAVLTQTTDSKLAVGRLVGHFFVIFWEWPRRSKEVPDLDIMILLATVLTFFHLNCNIIQFCPEM